MDFSLEVKEQRSVSLFLSLLPPRPSLSFFLTATISFRAASPESDINELPLEIPIINAAHFIGSEKPFRAEIKLELGRRLDKFTRSM